MRRLQRQRGSVLVFTLWLAAGLAMAALLAGHATVLRHRREAAETAEIETGHAIEGVLRYVTEVLTAAAVAGEIPDVDSYEAEDIEVGGCRVWLLGRAAAADDEDPVFALQDEAGRLNLNSATQEMLEALPGMTAELAAAIIDWRDTDSDVSTNGAESDTYLALEPPYTAKDGPFESTDELRLLNGADRLLLNGIDRNRNTLLETWEKDLNAQVKERFAEVPDFGIMDLVTVHSREPNTRSDGQSRTDLNSEAQTVRRVLTELYGSRADAIATTAGIPATGRSPNRFRSVLEFCIRGALTDSEAESAFDRFTVTSGSVTSGLVNLNTAPAAVLACLPGVGEDKAQALVAYREDNPDGLSTPLWLVAALGEDAALAAGPYVTTRSYQVTADIVAVSASGQAFKRVRFVLDTRTGSPVVVARHDLTPLGWPLGEALRQETLAASRERRT